jgi:hypothetical protein
MIDGLSLEYAYARIGACLGQRPDDRLWQQLRSARSVPALLELVRSSPAAAAVSGIPVGASGDVIELAFRQQLRLRIDDVASWAPPEWRPSLHYTRHVADLPALLHLLTGEPLPRWIAADPELSQYAVAGQAERRAAIAAGPLARLADAAEEDPALALGRRDGFRRVMPLLSAAQRALSAWSAEWRARWPATSHDIAAALNRSAQLLEGHRQRFATLAVADTQTARSALASTLASMVRRYPSHPAALYAYLGVFALDLERLRGEFVRCAYPLGVFK